MDSILIDTDILLDFFFDRKPFSDAAAQVLELCESKEVLGFVTPVIISNTYYLLRKVSKHELIVDKLNQLLHIIDVISMNRNVVIKALTSEFKDFEDALQNYSAIEASNISIILTRNTKDFKKSTLSIQTAETYLKTRNT